MTDKLWEAVVQQAIRDATLTGTTNTSKRAKHDARQWLTIPNRDFDEVCALAGLEPDWIRNNVSELIKRSDIQPPREKGGRKAMVITFNGLTLTLNEWADRCGVCRATLQQRLAKGWSLEKALTTPALRKRKRSPGVAEDLQESAGTGGGSTARDLSEIEFFASAKEAEPCL
jgi:hypothetical protein